MGRITEKFKELGHRREGALICFATAGYPSPDLTLPVLRTLSKHADILELGLPFSDPIADGPTIQTSSQKALEMGMNTELLFKIIREFRRGEETPLLVLSYYNPVLRFGPRKFARELSEAGGDGLIIPDLPVEEAGELSAALASLNLDLVLLAAPTSTEARLRKICESSRGFVYLVSVLGVTGARREVSRGLREQIQRIKRLSKIPVAVGFGVSKPQHVREILAWGADGVIVGSSLIECMAGNLRYPNRMLKRLEDFASKLKRATKQPERRE
jgi:tryptophan synthase alpha chain